VYDMNPEIITDPAPATALLRRVLDLQAAQPPVLHLGAASRDGSFALEVSLVDDYRAINLACSGALKRLLDRLIPRPPTAPRWGDFNPLRLCQVVEDLQKDHQPRAAPPPMRLRRATLTDFQRRAVEANRRIESGELYHAEALDRDAMIRAGMVREWMRIISCSGLLGGC
jgi:hypothetical protein